MRKGPLGDLLYPLYFKCNIGISSIPGAHSLHASGVNTAEECTSMPDLWSLCWQMIEDIGYYFVTRLSALALLCSCLSQALHFMSLVGRLSYLILIKNWQRVLCVMQPLERCLTCS